MIVFFKRAKNWLNEGNRIERIILLSQIEFKLRYYGNRLGLLWALINPISRIAMFYVMFILIMGGNKENFAVYLFSGFIIWIFFNDITSRSIIILKRKKALYENTNIDKFEIYLSLVFSCGIGLVFNFIVFIIIAIFSGITFSWYILLFPLIVFQLAILSLGVSLVLSNIYLLFKDIDQIWNIISMALFFLSPILFRGEVVGERVPIINYINPLAGILNNTREILINTNNLDWKMFAYDTVYALVILFFGVFLLKNISPKASEIA